MSVIATAVKHLIAAGVTGDALVQAIAEMEAAGTAQPDEKVTGAAIRMRRYRERRAANGMHPNKPEYLEHAASVKARDGACVYCESVEDLVIDHIIPVCQGGTDHPDNLATACRKCNAAKSGRTPEQWGKPIRLMKCWEAAQRYAQQTQQTQRYATTPSPLVPPLEVSPAPLPKTPPIIPPTNRLGVARDLETELREAAGWQRHPSTNLFVTGPVSALMDAGADLDLDILPTIRALAPKCSSPTWKFFLGAIARARDERLAAAKIVTHPAISGQANGYAQNRPEKLSGRQFLEIAKQRLSETVSRAGTSGGGNLGGDLEGTS